MLKLFFSVLFSCVLYSSCTVVDKSIITVDEGVLYSKKIAYRSRNITVLKYRIKNVNGVVVKKEKEKLNIRGTWSTPIFVASVYYDSITGKKTYIEKYWGNKIERQN